MGYRDWYFLFSTAINYRLGQCITKFSAKRIPFCVQFNPDPEKENQFLMGCQDKKIYQYDIRSGDIVQTYDQHMGAVNTITFLDQEGSRFVSTSDDKTLRAWKWDVPVVIKYVTEPDMHSMPAASLSVDSNSIFGVFNWFFKNREMVGVSIARQQGRYLLCWRSHQTQQEKTLYWTHCCWLFMQTRLFH